MFSKGNNLLVIRIQRLFSQGEHRDSSLAPHDNLHVGMVLLPVSLDVNLELEIMFYQKMSQWTPNQKAEGVRLWAKFFAPFGNREGVEIPKAWHDFFLMSLLNPASFEWASKFLGSKAWNFILKDRTSRATVTFSIPKNCPIESQLRCQA
jgi:hypothetical protein